MSRYDFIKPEDVSCFFEKHIPSTKSFNEIKIKQEVIRTFPQRLPEHEITQKLQRTPKMAPG